MEPKIMRDRGAFMYRNREAWKAGGRKGDRGGFRGREGSPVGTGVTTYLIYAGLPWREVRTSIWTRWEEAGRGKRKTKKYILKKKQGKPVRIRCVLNAPED